MPSHAVLTTQQILVELIDPWHPAGHQVRLPITETGDVPPQISMALRMQSERPDPVTKQRDPRTGSYVGHSTTDEGVPVYEWEWDDA